MEIKGQNVMTEWATKLRRDASITGNGTPTCESVI